MRRYGLVASAVVGGLGLVVLLVAVAIAVHRGLTAALVVSASLLGTALVLAGSGLVWSLLLASLVPPTLWWAARSLRRTG